MFARNVHGVRVEVAHPAALLWALCVDGGGFADAMQASLARRRPTPRNPWRLIVYADELTPGNVISHDNLRKAWTVYYSFMELPRRLLHSEDAWLPLALKRTSIVKDLPAGFSSMFAACLQLFFTGGAYDVSTTGWILTFADGTTVTLWLRLEMLIQDELAHKSVYHCKGASGTRFCMLCLNVRARRKDTLDLDDPECDVDETAELANADALALDDRIHRDELLVSDIITKSELHLADDTAIQEILDRLAVYATMVDGGAMSKADFNDREQANGFTHAPNGLLRVVALQPHVKPTQQYAHDPMHVLAVHGVINITLY